MTFLQLYKVVSQRHKHRHYLPGQYQLRVELSVLMLSFTCFPAHMFLLQAFTFQCKCLAALLEHKEVAFAS